MMKAMNLVHQYQPPSGSKNKHRNHLKKQSAAKTTFKEHEMENKTGLTHIPVVAEWTYLYIEMHA